MPDDGSFQYVWGVLLSLSGSQSLPQCETVVLLTSLESRPWWGSWGRGTGPREEDSVRVEVEVP